MGYNAEISQVITGPGVNASSAQASTVEMMNLENSNRSGGDKKNSMTLRVFSVKSIKELIAQGHAIVIYGKYVLKLDKWIERHPGGDKAIYHMIGRDAYDEMNSYHSPETIKHFKMFSIGVIDHRWINLLPPIQGGVYEGSDKTFEERSKQGKLMSGEMSVRINPKMPQGVIPQKGMNDLYKIVEPTPSNPIRDPEVIDNIIGTIIADWIGGLSLGWWKRNHNVHHLITNDPVHDPDIQHLPFFCVSTRLFGNLFSTYYERFLWFDRIAQKLIPLQSYLYYPILAFGRFNLYRLSLEYLLKGQGPRKGKGAWFRWFELAGLGFFCWWFFYIVCGALPTKMDRFQFIMVSHIATMVVHVQITLSHFAMSTSDLGTSETFAARQLRTSMDVSCPEWFDFFHGGLQYQAIHHMYPRMPRHNLRKAQKYVLEFCRDTGLKYSIYGFVNGNEKVLSKMDSVGRQVGIFRDCLKSMKMEDMNGKNMYEKKIAEIIKDD
ncbi:hypothetical protein HII13_001963 [Brettanomyces bruxellensis]|nr:hypothetical protein HII13_001963 [Brettanomyces bruxellensis]